METDLLNLKGEAKGKVDLPKIFSTPFRPDLIHRVYVALSTHSLQPQGRDPEAGERTSAESWGVGRGAARMARVKGGGTGRANKAAGVASVVGGRIPHPPRSEKRIRKEVNRKERRLAIASAIAATVERQIVSLRGHQVADVKSFPVVLVDNVEKISKTSELRDLFRVLNLSDDVERSARVRKARSGKSRMRGRTIRSGRGPLIVVAEDKGIGKAVDNLPGVECVLARDLTVTDLAPGSHPGRLVVWSESALGALPKPLLEVGELVAT
ncbi:MAG: 50S ribosomal protein L4 [Nitrososphaerales archaeon]